MKALYVFFNTSILYGVYAVLGIQHLLIIFLITTLVYCVIFLGYYLRSKIADRPRRLYLEDLCSPQPRRLQMAA